jgi:glutathione-specific gamma-glutamylcyclotransferase
MKDAMAADPEPLWIFAYGSLMWRPDFTFAERHRASLDGYRRALCIWSHHYRGTPAAPGLVFGLAPGGTCLGVAFGIAAEHRAATLAAVRARELVTHVYREVTVSVGLADGRTVSATTYIADVGHAQYAGALDEAAMLPIVRTASGVSGRNLAYVTNTRDHLRDLGVEDPDLTALCAALTAPGRAPPHG